MTLILYVTIGLLVAIVIALGFVIRYMVNYIMALQDALDNFSSNFDIIREASANLLLNMRNIDSSGAFESDDEVGATFSELHQLVTRFNEITDEYAQKEKS
jgi:hypothetical protein